MNKWNGVLGVLIGIYYLVKGLEFDVVLMFFCEKEVMFDKEWILVFEGEGEVKREDVKLIYVGVIRVKYILIIFYFNEIIDLILVDEELL